MYNSDLVFASPGLSFFEALIIGTPVICFHQNDLQKEVYAGYFNTFGEEDINKIISIELEKLVSRVQKMDFELEITEGATDYIASQGFDPEYGARPLKRAIQKYVEDVLTEEIIQQNPEKMSKLLLDYNKEDDKMVVVITSPPKKKVTRRKKDTDTE